MVSKCFFYIKSAERSFKVPNSGLGYMQQTFISSEVTDYICGFVFIGCGEVLFLYNSHGVRDKDLCILCIYESITRGTNSFAQFSTARNYY